MTNKMTTLPTTVSAPCPVADTMRRVQDQLRRGAAPTFEALLAFGEPSIRRSAA